MKSFHHHPDHTFERQSAVSPSLSWVYFGPHPPQGRISSAFQLVLKIIQKIYICYKTKYEKDEVLVGLSSNLSNSVIERRKFKLGLSKKGKIKEAYLLCL